MSGKTDLNRDCPAGIDPGAVSQTMVRHWQHQIRNPNHGYTATDLADVQEFYPTADVRSQEDFGTHVYKAVQSTSRGRFGLPIVEMWQLERGA